MKSLYKKISKQIAKKTLEKKTHEGVLTLPATKQYKTCKVLVQQ